MSLSIFVLKDPGIISVSAVSLLISAAVLILEGFLLRRTGCPKSSELELFHADEIYPFFKQNCFAADKIMLPLRKKPKQAKKESLINGFNIS